VGLRPGRAALWGVRETRDWRDTIYIAGFSQDCTGTRARKSSLIVPGGPLITEQIGGDAITVLRTVMCDWSPCPRPEAS
jgi:hypothetical protein